MGSTVKIYDVDKPTISIPYWQVAALGIVPVLGLGGFYYYYYRNKNKKHGKATTQQNGVMDKKLVQEQETDIKQSETVTGIDKVGLLIYIHRACTKRQCFLYGKSVFIRAW